MTDYSLTIEQARALVQSADQGDDFSTPDNARPDAHVHVRRVGVAGSKKGARAAVMMHGEDPRAMLVSLVSAPQARMLAAALLNAADEVDGTVPLTFFPARFVEDEDLDDPTVETDAVVIDLDGLAEPGVYDEADEVQDAIERIVDEVQDGDDE